MLTSTVSIARMRACVGGVPVERCERSQTDSYCVNHACGRPACWVWVDEWRREWLHHAKHKDRCVGGAKGLRKKAGDPGIAEYCVYMK